MRRRTALSVLVVGLLLMLPLVALGVLFNYPNHTFIDNWGGPGSDPGEFGDPAGITEAPNGEIFVTDASQAHVSVFDPDGTYLRRFGTAGAGPTQMLSPEGLVVTDEDLVYVTDYVNDRVQVWDTAGNHVDSFGASGSGNGQLDGPCDVALGPDGLLYVAEWSNHRVQVFTQEGDYVRKWGTLGNANGQFENPIGLEFSRDGRLYVADSSNDRIQYFTPLGTYLGKFGSTGTGNGQFSEPYDVRFDPHGNIYVADSDNNRVQKFTAAGTFVTKFGASGTTDGMFDFAWSVLPNRERYVLVTDEGNGRVQRWFTPTPATEQPVAGNTRFTTAIAASVAGYPAGLMEDTEGFKTVIISTGRNWPDALGGATLAGVLDAPILLVDTNVLPPAVATEIARLGATRAIVLGGTAAVSANVANAIDSLPGIVEVERIGGANRYLTSEAIAWRAVKLQPIDYDYTAFVATGENFPDALACSPIAAANGWPLYLAPPSGLRASTKAAMEDAEIMDAYILGGTAAVSSATESQIKELAWVKNVDRIEGSTRYATAVEIGRFGESEAMMNWTYTALATGLDFPDALTGGPMQGKDRSIMLLTKGEGGPPSVVTGAIEDHKNAVWTMRYLGGTAAVPQATRGQIADLLY